MTLVPQSINDRRSKTFYGLSKRLDALPVNKTQVRDFDKTDARGLSLLVKEFQLEDFVTGSMSEEMIRRLLKESDNLRRLTGTPAAVKRALETVGIVGIVTEWWETEPPAEPGTFKIEALVNENLVPISQPVFSPERVKEAYRLIDAAKRKSQHYTMTAGSLHKATLFFGSSFWSGQKTTGRMRLESS